MKNIILLGDYSGNNAGHNALLLSIIHEINLVVPSRFIVPSLHPKKLKKALSTNIEITFLGVAPWHGCIKFLGFPLWKMITVSDCILLTDNLFYDKSILNPIKNNLIALILITYIAKQKKIPVVYYNSGIGPLETDLGCKCVRWLAERMDALIVRDENSKLLLTNIAPTVNATVSADSGFSISYDRTLKSSLLTTAQPGSQEKSQWLGINLSYHFFKRISWKNRGNQFLQSVYKLVATNFERVATKLSAGLLFFVTHPADKKFTDAVIEHLSEKITFQKFDCNDKTVSSILLEMQRSFCFIGNRYHEIVMCAALKIPVIGINCGDKIAPLFNALKMPDLILDVGDFCLADAGDKIARLVEQAFAFKELLISRVEELRSAANRTARILVELGYIS